MQLFEVLSQAGFAAITLFVVISVFAIVVVMLQPKGEAFELTPMIRTCEEDMVKIYQACQKWRANNAQDDFTGLDYAALATTGLWDSAKTNPWGADYNIRTDETGVWVYSGALPDVNVRNQLEARFRGKGYLTESWGCEATILMAFKGPVEQGKPFGKSLLFTPIRWNMK